MTGLILAGGRARRLGGRDKGLVAVAGRPLVAHVLAALRPQTDSVLISANRNLDRYREFGVPVLADAHAGFAGPLAGIARGLAAAPAPLVLCVPCDAPLLPADLAPRLAAALTVAGGRRRALAVAHDGSRRQPLFALLRRDLHADLEAWIARGGRRVGDWVARLDPVEVDFADRAGAFLNVNTPADLARVAERLSPMSPTR